MLIELTKSLLRNRAIKYIIAAGVATIVDVGIYFISFNYIFQKQDFRFSFGLLLTAPIASLIVSFSCGLLTNFFISKYFVFKDAAKQKSHIQFLKFASVAFGTLIANYLFMKLLIVGFGLFPTVSRLISAITIGALSFMAHKIFSFKAHKINPAS